MTRAAGRAAGGPTSGPWAVAVALALAWPAPAVFARNGSVPPDTAAVVSYTIGPQDVLDIRVWKNEALSCVVPVRPDGMISIPLIHDVPAAGLTPMQLRSALVQRLAAHIESPEVSVIVSEVRSFEVTVMGEVPKPGRYALRRLTTVLEILAEAGGFTPYASKARITILRREGDRVRRLPFDYRRAIEPRGRQENLVLHRGDIILVP